MAYPPCVQLNRLTLQAVVVSKMPPKVGGGQVLFYPQTYNRSLSEGQMTNHNEANRKA